jgi:hypothetical protein
MSRTPLALPVSDKFRFSVFAAVSSPDLYADALDAYEQAVARARLAREAWDELGRPITSAGSRGQARRHPLLAVIHDAESLADKLRKSFDRLRPPPSPRELFRDEPPRIARARPREVRPVR